MRRGVVIVFALMAAQAIAIAAWGQSPGYMPSTIDRRLKSPPSPQVKDKWNTLSETEISCIERALEQENTNVAALMQKGIIPSDPVLSKIRSDCRVELDASAAADQKKIIALSEKLNAAQIEIRELRATIARLNARQASTRPTRGNGGPAAAAVQRESSDDAIGRLAKWTIVILAFLALIGYFAPDRWKQKRMLAQNR